MTNPTRETERTQGSERIARKRRHGSQRLVEVWLEGCAGHPIDPTERGARDRVIECAGEGFAGYVDGSVLRVNASGSDPRRKVMIFLREEPEHKCFRWNIQLPDAVKAAIVPEGWWLMGTWVPLEGKGA